MFHSSSGLQLLLYVIEVQRTRDPGSSPDKTKYDQTSTGDLIIELPQTPVPTALGLGLTREECRGKRPEAIGGRRRRRLGGLEPSGASETGA